MQFQREEYSDDFLQKALPLFVKHYQEIAHFKDIPLEPDFEQYKKIAELGMLRIFTAREEDSSLLGYAVFFVRNNPHYMSSKQAVEDVLYIDPDKRGFGTSFLKWQDEQLFSEGCQIVYRHVKKAHDYSVILNRMNYELVDLLFAKRSEV